MKRQDFLKNLGIGALGLSTFSFQDILERKSVIIYDNYLRGTFAYDLEKVAKQLKVGQELILQRETTNEYDSYAIAIYYKKYKLGYIAAYENIVLANMIDHKVLLKTTISFIDVSRPKNQQIAVQIFCDLIAPTPLLVTKLEKRADDAHDKYRKGPFA